MQPLKIKIGYGETVIPAGTRLAIVSHDATTVRANYLGEVQTIPLSLVRIESAATAQLRSSPSNPSPPETNTPQLSADGRVIPQPIRPSSLSLEVHETGSGGPAQTRLSGSGKTYRQDYQKAKKIAVTVRDFSRQAQQVVAHIYFVARPLDGGPRYVYAIKDLPIELNGRLEATAETESPQLKSTARYYAGRRLSLTGKDIDGWIVVGEVSGQRFQIKASSPTLLEIAEGRGNHNESFPQLFTGDKK